MPFRDSDINYNIQKKINKLESVVDILKQNEINTTSISADINGIISYLKILQSRLTNNQISIQFYEKTLNLQKESLQKDIKSLNKRVSDNNQLLTEARQHINDIEKQLTQIKIHLTENIGQTNQCYIALDKLQKKIQMLHPFNVNQSIPGPKLFENNIKKMFSRVIVGIIVLITTGFGSYYIAKYWNKFIDDQYNKIHTQQNINNNQKNK